MARAKHNVAAKAKQNPMFKGNAYQGVDAAKDWYSHGHIDTAQQKVNLDVDTCKRLHRHSDCSVPVAWDSQRFKHVDTIQAAARNMGTVELAEDQHTGRRVAIKAMPLSWTGNNHNEFLCLHPKENEMPWRDVAITHYLSKDAKLDCVCEFVGLFRRSGDESDEICLVLSYCAGGDLFSWLEASTPISAFSDREALQRTVLRRVFQAVNEVHKHGIAHGDLSLENVLVKADEERRTDTVDICLIDFGAATSLRACGLRGKPSYQAPEMHTGDEYDAQAADSFSLGVIAYTLLVGNYPWASTKPNHCPRYSYVAQKGFLPFMQRNCVRSPLGAVLPLASALSPGAISLLSGLLTPNPSERLSVSAALTHPWTLNLLDVGVSAAEAA